VVSLKSEIFGDNEGIIQHFLSWKKKTLFFSLQLRERAKGYRFESDMPVFSWKMTSTVTLRIKSTPTLHIRVRSSLPVSSGIIESNWGQYPIFLIKQLCSIFTLSSKMSNANNYTVANLNQHLSKK